jgi:hypothetical protein
MITALDTGGAVYLCLMQANSNTGTMKLYFGHLIKHLDMAIPKWRSTHVLMLDNAPYHRAKETLEYLAEK